MIDLHDFYHGTVCEHRFRLYFIVPARLQFPNVLDTTYTCYSCASEPEAYQEPTPKTEKLYDIGLGTRIVPHMLLHTPQSRHDISYLPDLTLGNPKLAPKT